MISSQMIGKITKVGLMINRLKMEKINNTSICLVQLFLTAL